MTNGNLTLVFVGTSANDGTGDTLRQSFITTNNNMALISNTLGSPLGTTIISNSSALTFVGNVETVIDSFGNTVYRSAKYIASISNSPNYQASELLLVQDGSNANCQVIGETIIGTSLTTFTANIVSGNVLLWAMGNALISSNTTIKLQTIYMPVYGE